MSVIKIRDNIYAVGAQDPDVRIFHGYKTPFGTTYNTYLVQDGGKNILIDNVKAAFTEEYIRNIEEIIPLEKIDLIIQNHIEPDHSGSLPAIAARIPHAPIYCTAGAQKGIAAYYGPGFNCHVVKPGETLCTGNYTFRFFPAPMVHWPDSMLTYLEEEKILFSNDAFGQHVCLDCTYDDELGLERLMERAVNYYGNIILPFGMQVQKILGQVEPLKIDMICPSHGVILRAHIADVVYAYDRWCHDQADENRVVIVYDTMWGGTEKMANEIAEEHREQGQDVRVYCLRDVHYSEVMGDLVEAKSIFIGASTLNRNMMPTVAAFITYMKGLWPKKRTGMAFGSYGWSGESIGQAEEIMQSLGWEMLPQRKMVYMGL